MSEGDFNLNELPYYSDLLKIRKEFEQFCLGFPFGKCYLAARAVFNDLGLLEVGGLYVPTLSDHAWNYDSARHLYIDLTMSQFDDVYIPITILPADNYILRELESHSENTRETSYSHRYSYKSVIVPVRS